MSVSLTTPPPAYAFSKNHIEIGLTSNDYLDQVGVAAINEVGISGAISVDTTISIKYGTTTVDMVAAAAPDQSGYQFPAGDGTQTYINSLLAYFQANHILSRDFDIIPSGTSIRFIAKKKAYGFDFTNSNGAGFLTIKVTSGQPQKVKSGFGIFFELYAETYDHSAFEKVFSTTSPLSPGLGGLALIDIAPYLHSFFETAQDKIPVDFPDSATAAATLCKKSSRKYYFRYAETWDNQVQKVATSANYTILYGGLSTTGVFKFTLASLFVPDAANASKDRFLKQGNVQIYTRTNQPQYLYFFNTRATANNVKLKAKFYYTNNTSEVQTKTTFNLEQYRKYGFNTRFDVIYSNALQAGRTVERYEVWLENSASARISEIRTYWMNYELREFVRYFIYGSSWGGLDTLLCYGKGNSEFERSQQSAQRIRRAGQDIKTGDRTVFDVKINEGFKVATGWMSRTDLANSRDFFLSKFTYRYVGGLTLPIEITSKNIPETEDGVNRYARLFEYKYLFDDHSYTEGDVEDPGTGFDGFFFQSSNPVNPTGGLQEIDPTVPSWVKSITQADITKWNSLSSSVGPHAHAIGDITDLQTALASKLSGNVNDWIKNQAALQAGAQFHVSKGRVVDELYIPTVGFSSGEKVRIKFSAATGSGGTTPPPPLTEVGFADILGVATDNASLVNSFYPRTANPNNYITISALSGYATEAFVTGQGYLTAEADDFIKNRTILQSGAQFHVSKGRVVDELYIPTTGFSSGEKARIKFSAATGSGGTTPPPPLTSVGFADILGVATDNASLVNSFYPKTANPAGYITSAALSGYATESFVTGQGYLTAAANDFVKNQSAIQSAAQFHVSKGRVVDELYIPTTGFSGGEKARIKFSNTTGTGGEPPPPPLTSVAWGDVIGTLSNQTDLQNALNGRYTKTESDGRYLGISATAANSTKWNNTEMGASQTGATGITHMYGYNSGANTAHVITQAAARLFLGLGSAAYLNNGALTASSLVSGSVSVTNNAGWFRVQTASGYIDLGPANTSYAHIYTDRPEFYFNKDLKVLGATVLHTGNVNLQNVTDGGAISTNPITVNSASAGANLFIAKNATQEIAIGVNTTSGGAFLFVNTAHALRLGTSGAERVRVDASGNVGIGMTPTYKLDVTGDIRTSGYLYSSGVFGLYNSTYGTYWRSQEVGGYSLRSNHTYSRISMKCDSETAVGYFFANNANEIGILNHAGGWSIRTDANRKVFADISLDSPIIRATSALYIPNNLPSGQKVRIKFIG